jgi:hypothetical protein
MKCTWRRRKYLTRPFHHRMLFFHLDISINDSYHHISMVRLLVLFRSLFIWSTGSLLYIVLLILYSFSNIHWNQQLYSLRYRFWHLLNNVYVVTLDWMGFAHAELILIYWTRRVHFILYLYIILIFILILYFLGLSSIYKLSTNLGWSKVDVKL